MKKVLSLFLFSMIIITANIASANSDLLYSVDVYVDVSDESASIAKDQAMKQAHRTAFQTVIQKVTNQAGIDILSTLDDDQILNFIKEVAITSEKSSNIRYIANLKVKINEDILRQYMVEKNIIPAIITTSKVLVIPTFREFKTDTPLLWEAKNIWKKTWEETASKNDDIVKFITIASTGSNYASLDSKKAVNLDETAMKQIAFHNSTDDIFIADAYYQGIEGMTINLSSYQDGRTETIEVYGERSTELLTNSIEEIKRAIIERLKEQSIAENSQVNEINVMYNYPSISDWIKIEKALKRISLIESSEITAMSNGTVQLSIKFTSSIDKLNARLADENLKLEDQEEYYNLTRI